MAGGTVSTALCRKLRTQPVKVRAAAVVLELASYLHLLGLGSAAPHWLDPLERPEPVRPHDASVTGVPGARLWRDTQENRRGSPLGTSARASFPYRYNRTRFAALMPTPIRRSRHDRQPVASLL